MVIDNRLVLIYGGILIVLGVVVNLTSATSPVLNESAAFPAVCNESKCPFFKKYMAHLSYPKWGPIVSTNASGIVTLSEYSDFPQDISYKSISLQLKNIDKVISAHVHTGIVSEGGPVVFTLFNTSKPTGEINGSLVWINITSSNPIKLEGPMSSKNLSDLFHGGPYYIDVHTKEYPEGEIMGDLQLSIIS